jgi:uncharacterized membrane protein (DUF441 family)
MLSWQSRYTYIPSIGIAYLAAEGLHWLFAKSKLASKKIITGTVIAMCVVFFGYTTYARCKDWKNELVLWTGYD